MERVKMMNSPYINHTILTNKHSGRRTHKVQAFVIHQMAAVWTGKRCAEYFTYETDREASANYCIGYNGDVALNVDENNRAWTSSSAWADNRAITYELSNSQIGEPWKVSDKTIQKLIIMLAEQHKRYGLRASYTGNTNGTLWRHDWFTKTNCPGSYLGSKLKYIADEVNKILDSKTNIQHTNNNKEGVLNMSGSFQVNDKIFVYNEPKVNYPKGVIATYEKGETVHFENAVIKNNYVWLKYKRNIGGYGYLPISPVKEIWGKFL